MKDEATDKSRPSCLKVRSVDSQDVDAVTEDDTQVTFNRDIWTYCALVGLGRTGSWDARFTFILALASLAMQGAFVMILMSEFFLEGPFEEKVELARIWHTTVAHDCACTRTKGPWDWSWRLGRGFHDPITPL